MFFQKIINFCSVHAKQRLGPITARESVGNMPFLFCYMFCAIFIDIGDFVWFVHIWFYIYLTHVCFFLHQCKYCFVWTYQNNRRALIGRSLHPAPAPSRRGPAYGAADEKCFPPFCRKPKKSNHELLRVHLAPTAKTKPAPSQNHRQNEPYPLAELTTKTSPAPSAVSPNYRQNHDLTSPKPCPLAKPCPFLPHGPIETQCAIFPPRLKGFSGETHKRRDGRHFVPNLSNVIYYSVPGLWPSLE